MAEHKDFDWGNITYPVAYTRSLFRIVKERQPKRGLEIGFDQGASALAFLRACEGTLLSVDIFECEEARKRVEAQFGADRFTFLCRDSRIFLKDFDQQFDYIYIDGDHLYDAVKQDLFNAVKLLATGGVMVVDDCVEGHGLFGVWEAVRDLLQAHPEFVKLPLDESTSGAVILTRNG